MKFSVVFIGVILVVLSVLAYMHIVTENGHYFGLFPAENESTPYRDFSFTIFLIGVVGIIIGLALNVGDKKSDETKSNDKSPPPEISSGPTTTISQTEIKPSEKTVIKVITETTPTDKEQSP